MLSRFLTIAPVLAVMTFMPTQTQAQRLALQGGPVIIELDPISTPVGEDRSSRLRWNQVRSPSKIMVSSSTTAQRYDLYVDAIGVRRGEGVGEVKLVSGQPAQDFIIGVRERGAGRCTLGYRAETRAEQGYGTEVHSVTYTITGL